MDASKIKEKLDRQFYLVLDDLGNGKLVIGETTIPEQFDQKEADAVAAMSQCVGKPVRVYRANLATLMLDDASEDVAEYLVNQCMAAGEEPIDSPYAEFIHQHAPAHCDVGYRGNDDHDDEKVYCPHRYPEAAE